METKYYAPQGQLLCLTLATHSGKLTYSDVLNNLMRMALMDDQEVPDAEEAMQEIKQMSQEQYSNLRAWCQDRMAQEDFQLYLDSHPLPIGEEMEPITEVEAMWEELNEFSLQVLEQCKLTDDATRE